MHINKNKDSCAKSWILRHFFKHWQVNISIQNLTKIYKNGNRALKGINLEIEHGMFGLLGPNGAGKSTLMRILVTLMKPSEGKILVNGMDLHEHRKQVRGYLGYLPQDFAFFAKLKTWEFLDYAACLAGLSKTAARKAAVEEMLENVGLYEVRERMANKLSGGMKRRLGIAQALIGDPKIVIVDEPTTGLDPDERIRFRNLLSKMSQRDIIIILSTHIVGDISSTCRSMALLNNGEVVFHGAPDKIIQEAEGKVWSIQATNREFEMIKEKFPVISTIPEGDGWEVQVVADDIDGFAGQPITPNLEHSYVYFMEYKLDQLLEKTF